MGWDNVAGDVAQSKIASCHKIPYKTNRREGRLFKSAKSINLGKKVSPKSLVGIAVARDNGENRYNWKKKYPYHAIFAACRGRTMPFFRLHVSGTQLRVRRPQGHIVRRPRGGECRPDPMNQKKSSPLSLWIIRGVEIWPNNGGNGGNMGRIMRFRGLIRVARCRFFGSCWPRLSRGHRQANPELRRPQGRCDTPPVHNCEIWSSLVGSTTEVEEGLTAGFHQRNDTT